ncbi:response regulator [Novosphingobium sp. EMRT-2]|nr:response regulator [Novosphingobium sp. EMRT-2]
MLVPGPSPKMPVIIGIVDDDDDVREALEEMLESHGYLTISFKSATDFLKSADVARMFCVITDFQMPGLTGLDLIDALREFGLPTILITAFATPMIEQQARNAGVHRFLRKPFNPQQLVAAIKSIRGGML